MMQGSQARMLRIGAAMLACVVSVAWGGPLDSRVASIVSQSDLGGATVAVHAVDLGTGAEVAAYNADKAMIPASNMKLITSGVALTVLGDDFVYRTELRVDRSVSPPRLVVVGSGDPALGDPVLLEREEVGLSLETLMDQIATTLKSQGVTAIGEVVVDDRIFDHEGVHPSWPTDQLNRWYCAEVGGLNFYRNVVMVYTEPTSQGGSPLTTLVPDAPWIELANRAKTDREGSNTAWVSRPSPSDDMTLMGKVRTRTEIEVAIHDPAAWGGRVIANEMSKRGITVGSGDKPWKAARVVQEGENFDAAPTVAVITTPISDVLTRVNTDSHNLYAECLIKRIGHDVTGEAGSWANGSAVVRMKLADALGPGMAESTTVVDGSGMSRDNRVRPSTFTGWMRWLSHDSARWKVFKDSLATPGVGTLRNRFGDRELACDINAKSGYLTGVYSLSGVLTEPRTGRQVVFSIILNDVPSGRQAANAKPLHEKIVGALDAWLSPTANRDPANLGG